MATQDRIRPAIMIGLVGAVGTNLNDVSNEFEASLREVGYDSRVVHLSKYLPTVDAYLRPKGVELTSQPLSEVTRGGYEYYVAYMDAGDALREKTDMNDAMARLVFGMMLELTGSEGAKEPKGTAFIIRSLKTPEEIAALRRVYGSRFFVVAAYAPRESRKTMLAQRIAKANHELHSSPYYSAAEQLISRDEHDSERDHGQRVRKAFPEADFFISATDRPSITHDVKRTIRILFGDTFITPTRDEYGMFLAVAAARRSAALGRQVGAVIASKEGDVISVGTNEVAKCGGGLYWEGDFPDKRDFHLGFDTNDVMIQKVLGELLRRFKNANWLNEKVATLPIERLVELSLLGGEGESPILQGAQLDSIIEFGRCVHAEMAAIVDAAKRGVSVDKSTLFTSTFPCHECARHIVAAGIHRVVYVSPYPKSLVRELYPDSIRIEPSHANAEPQNYVDFEPFTGVSPRQYLNFFSMLTRKEVDGTVREWEAASAEPRLGPYTSPFGQISRDQADQYNLFFKKLDSLG